MTTAATTPLRTRGDRASRFPAWLRREVEVITPELAKLRGKSTFPK